MRRYGSLGVSPSREFEIAGAPEPPGTGALFFYGQRHSRADSIGVLPRLDC
jgi:hypothetical protein